MKFCLKITAGLLLLVQALHLASLQQTTNSPGKQFDPAWLRDLAKGSLARSQNSADSEEQAAGKGSSNDYLASGFMSSWPSEEEENVAAADNDASNTDDTADVSITTAPPTETTEPHEAQNTITSISASTDQTSTSTSTSTISATEAEDESLNSTSTSAPTPEPSPSVMIVLNTTSSPDYSSESDLNTTTLAPEVNATQEATTKPENVTESINATESTSTTPLPTTTTPETNSTPTVYFTTSLNTAWTTEISPETTTTAPMNTSGNANNTDKASASGNSAERGVGSDSTQRRHSAWGTILGTAVAVVCVGLVAFVILKHKHQKGFSHRKLVEEFPSDPVHRLDNNEPLDLHFGGSAYYNPALQGDNIQMSNFQGRP